MCEHDILVYVEHFEGHGHGEDGWSIAAANSFYHYTEIFRRWWPNHSIEDFDCDWGSAIFDLRRNLSPERSDWINHSPIGVAQFPDNYDFQVTFDAPDVPRPKVPYEWRRFL